MKFFVRYSVLWCIVLLALVLRLYRVDYPLLDWHSFRQVDTASVTREYLKNGIDILRPEYHDLGDIQSGLHNIDGYRMVEFPFVNALTAGLIKVIPILPLVPTSRVISILFSLGTLVSLFFLTKQLSGKKVAYLAALTFAVLPYIVYYSRAVLPESPLVFFSVLSLWTFFYGIKKDQYLWIIVSVVALSVAFLLKPFAVFLLPVYVTGAVLQFGKNVWKKWYLYLFFFSPLPFLAWRSWITQFPTGIPASDWLYNSDGIRLRPAWFRWLFFERLTKMQLGFFGLAFLPFILKKITKDVYIYLAWWLGIACYFIIIATGNVRHDYYQYFTTPILSITVGYGVLQLYKTLYTIKIKALSKHTKHLIALTTCAILYICMLFFGLRATHGFFNVNNWEYVTAGKRADEILPADALVIAPAFGDTAFLFQTNRKGWPIGFNIEEKIEKGATHYISTSYDDEARMLEDKYFIVEKTDLYIIIDLTKEKETNL